MKKKKKTRRDQCIWAILGFVSTLEATQGQIDGFFSQLPYKCYLEEFASVGD